MHPDSRVKTPVRAASWNSLGAMNRLAVAALAVDATLMSG